MSLFSLCKLPLKGSRKLFKGSVLGSVFCLVLAFFAVFSQSGFCADSNNQEKIGAASVPGYLESSVTKEFGSLVENKMAEDAAVAEARIKLAYAGIKMLSENALVQFVLGNGASGPGVSQGVLLARQNPAALVMAITTQDIKEKHSRQGENSLEITVTVGATPYENMPERLKNLLRSPDTLELYGAGLAQLEKYLPEYDAIAKTAINQGNTGAYTASVQGVLKQKINSLRSVMFYLDALIYLDGSWQNIDEVRQMLDQAMLFDRENALALCALGEISLQYNRPLEAIDRLNAAIRINGDLARAYHSRGAAYLRVQSPALAVQDFTEAIKRSGRNAGYFEDRAAAWLIKENIPAMCDDFLQACSLGSCSGYYWAVEQKKCAIDPNSPPVQGGQAASPTPLVRSADSIQPRQENQPIQTGK